MPIELTEEDVFSNDIDPIDAIRELRKEEGQEVDDDLQSSVERDTSKDAQSASTDDDDGSDELEEFKKTTDDKSDDKSDDTDDKDDEQTKSDESKDESKDDGDKSEDDDNDEEDLQTEGKKTETEVKSRTFKANGQEFNFTEQEIIDQFETIFGQAMNYTQKMQKIAPYRKMISALEEQGLTQDQLNIAIDALKGDKGALAQIVKAHQIEAFDLTEDDAGKDYSPTSYGKDDRSLEIGEISEVISVDKEYPITVDIIGKQWDATSRDAFASNPKLILGLHNDVKSGKYDEVAPMAMKMKVLDGNTKSDIEYYMLAGEQIRTAKEAATAQQQNQQQVDQTNQQTQDAVSKSEEASSEAQRKRSASSTRTRADRKGVIDYLDDDDDKFDNWYKTLMSSN
jgi:hypothetical protein